MLAKDVMTTKVIGVTPDTPVEEIARTMLKCRISAVPVIDADHKLVGIVSEGDLMRRVESGTERHSSWWLRLVQDSEEKAANYLKSHGRSAKDVMTSSVITIRDDVTLAEIAELLEQHGIKRVPVVREGELVGIVSRANLLQGLAVAKVSRPAALDDQAIRSSITSTIRNEAGVEDRYINVIVSDGVVHLWGAVETETEKQAILAAVENTDGVSGFEDHLGVLSMAGWGGI